MPDRIPLFEIAWDKQDIVNAVESIGRGSHWAKGPFVKEFESRLADYFGVAHAITVNSGTTALVAALEAYDIGPGDEVIVPSFTFIATANAVRLVGAEPVFADVESDTFGLDPDSVRSQLTERTAAILPVHVYGAPCQIEALREIALSADVLLIEDAAEAFGATNSGDKVGAVGDAGVLSFCQNKIVVTGEGGAILTDDDEVASRIRLYRSHGRPEGDYFGSVDSGEYISLGTNIRMSDLTAAVGCAQLDKVAELIENRQRAAAALTDRLSTLDGVEVHAPRSSDTHVYQLYTIVLDSIINRSRFVSTLDNHGISSKIYWDTPVHQTSYYESQEASRDADLPVTEDLATRVLSLPIFPDLSPGQVARIGDAVEAGLSEARQ